MLDRDDAVDVALDVGDVRIPDRLVGSVRVTLLRLAARAFEAVGPEFEVAAMVNHEAGRGFAVLNLALLEFDQEVQILLEAVAGHRFLAANSGSLGLPFFNTSRSAAFS